MPAMGPALGVRSCGAEETRPCSPVPNIPPTGFPRPGWGHKGEAVRGVPRPRVVSRQAAPGGRDAVSGGRGGAWCTSGVMWRQRGLLRRRAGAGIAPGRIELHHDEISGRQRGIEVRLAGDHRHRALVHCIRAQRQHRQAQHRRSQEAHRSGLLRPQLRAERNQRTYTDDQTCTQVGGRHTEDAQEDSASKRARARWTHRRRWRASAFWRRTRAAGPPCRSSRKPPPRPAFSRSASC